MTDFNFYIPTRVVYGAGKIKEITKFFPEKTKSILIITDSAVYQYCNIARFIEKELKDYDCYVFKDIEENPSYETIENASNFAWKKKVDLIIGFGGGSPMDAAKGVAAFSNNSEPVLAYMDGAEIQNTPLPIIQVPTTSGTGSEVTPYAIFTDTKAQLKKCFSHPEVFAQTCIIDPELTYTMPAQVTCNTGMDVLCHAIEAYLSLDGFSMNDMYAKEAIEVVIKHLPKAIKNDKDAMDAMAYASMLAGVAISHASTILLHIMAYPLTIYHGLPHGKANGVLLPAFMDFMRENSTAGAKIEWIDARFKKVGGVRNFIRDLGVDLQLSSYGVTQDEFLRFAQDTIIKSDIEITPAKIELESIVSIYRSTF